MTRLRSFLNSHLYFLYLFSTIYSLPFILFHFHYILSGKLKVKGAFIRNCRINANSSKFIIEIGMQAQLKKCSLNVYGGNTEIRIGQYKTIVSNTDFYVADNNSKILIGEDFTMEGGHIASTEGKSITIGNDCMFSSGLEIRNGDSHSIISADNGQRLNPAKDVIIGNHVWLCSCVKVLKGSYIPDDCIIGNSSVVSGVLEDSHSIYAGIPLKKVKNSISWVRTR